MRRSDREVTSPEEIAAIMSRCQVLHLALNGEEVPYLLPVNFGMEADGMTLYIHGAMEGTKYGLIARDNRASFAMVREDGLVLDEKGHSCTMNYESVVGRGVIDELTEEADKRHALDCLMAHYHAEDFPYSPKPIPQTRILRLRVQSRTAKRRKKTI